MKEIMLQKLVSELPEGYVLYGMGPLVSTVTSLRGSSDIIAFGTHSCSWITDQTFSGTAYGIYAVKAGTPIAFANGIYPQSFGGPMPADHVCVGFGPHSYQQRDTSSGWGLSAIYTKYTDDGIRKTYDATFTQYLYAVPVSVAQQHFGFSDIRIASSIPEHTGPVGLDNEEDFPEQLREWARNNQQNTTMPTTTDTTTDNADTTATITLEVGAEYQCNNGEIVTIVENDYGTYPFRGVLGVDREIWYTVGGRVAGASEHYSLNIRCIVNDADTTPTPVESTAPAPDTLVLEVGKRFITRGGNFVTIEREDDDRTFLASNGLWYRSTGVICGGDAPFATLVCAATLELGQRYVCANGTIVTVDTDDGSTIPFRASYSNGGYRWYRRDGKAHGVIASDTLWDIVAVAPQEDVNSPLTLRVGGFYEQRNGVVVGPLRPRSSSKYPFTDGGTSWAPNGVYNVERETEYDIVKEVPSLPQLQPGMVYVRRDGTLSGRVWEYTDGGNGAYSNFYDERTNETYSAHGAYVGRPSPQDLISLADPQPESPALLPCELDKSYVTVRGTIVGPLEHIEDGLWRCPESSILYKESGIPDNINRMGYQLTSYASDEETAARLRLRTFRGLSVSHSIKLAMPTPPAGYDGWYVIGYHARGNATVPWIYYNTNGSWGDIKYEAPKGGRQGAYAEAYKLPSPNPTTVAERKEAASYKAYDKFWSKFGTESRDETSQFMLVYSFLHENGITDAQYHSDEEALVLTYENGYFKCEQIRYGKLWQRVNPDGSDDKRREFTTALDRVIKGLSSVRVEWSTVDETYRTPMEGWEDEDDSITGSCMEKFCNDDGCGHAVFDIYANLEHNGNLKMIKIFMDDGYVGRVICWSPDSTYNGWVMDRVYCRQTRGEISSEVFAELARFAAAENILGRTEKCKVMALPEVRLSNIVLDDADNYRYYPYFDTYQGVSHRGVVMSGCSIECKDADGGEQEDRSDYRVPHGREDRYHESDLLWSDRYDDWIHEDDAVTTHDDEIIHTDDAVEVGYDSNVYAHIDDCSYVTIYTHRGSRVEVYALN